MDVFTSDWHLDHNNIIKYAGRVQFMSSKERDIYEELVESNQLYSKKDATKLLRISRKSTDLMNESLIEGVNAVAGPRDTVWCLGDAFFGRDLNRLRDLRKRFRAGTINLVLGNHDKFIRKLHKRWDNVGTRTTTPEMVSRLRDIISQTAMGKLTPERAEILARKVETKHPLHGIFDRIFYQTKQYIGGEQEVFMNHYAHVVWDKSHHGVWSLYGHSHANLEDWRELHMPNAKTLDVGVDYRAKLGLGYTPWTYEELKSWMEGRSGNFAADHHDETDEQEKHRV